MISVPEGESYRGLTPEQIAQILKKKNPLDVWHALPKPSQTEKPKQPSQNRAVKESSSPRRP